MQQGNRVASLAAALVLVVGMGFGRFAFTGLYPLMVAGHQISVEGGSYAASANYAGYLIGALLAALLTGISSRQLCQAAVIATVVLLGVLFLALPEWAVITVRGFAGAASAIAMVAASQWLIHDMQHHHGAPALFAGVGAGILLSAELIALSHLVGLSSFGGPGRCWVWRLCRCRSLPSRCSDGLLDNTVGSQSRRHLPLKRAHVSLARPD